MLCRSCGKENREGERSCCYCLAPLVDVASLFQAVMEGKKIPNMPKKEQHEGEHPVLRKEEEPIAESEMILLSDEDLVLLPPDRDFSHLISLCMRLQETQEDLQRRDILKEISAEALQASRGLGRIISMNWGAKPIALVVEGFDDERRWKELMEVLKIPIFMAKYLSSGKKLEIACYANSRTELQILAVQYQQIFSKRAYVVSKHQIQEEPPAVTCLGCKGQRFRIVDEPLWLKKNKEIQEEEISFVPTLAVIGIIEKSSLRTVSKREVRSFGRRKKETYQQRNTAERVGVIDLHSSNMVLRIVEGVSDFSTLPGYEKGAQRKSFHNLSKLLPVWLSNIYILPQKSMRIKGDRVEQMDAWPEWERYSYCARILFFSQKKSSLS